MFSNEILVKKLAELGVTVGGDSDVDIHINDKYLFVKLYFGRSLALGETYMDRGWEANNLYAFASKMFNSDLAHFFSKRSFGDYWRDISARVRNLQNIVRARQVVKQHYNINDDIYDVMLDESMAYTCGYWPHADNLAMAQVAKANLVCQKLGLESEDKTLDVGCGWGGFADFAARKYGAEVVGVTLSSKQANIAKERTKNLPVEIRTQDYREIHEENVYDKVTSIGMLEHVGVKNYDEFFRIIHRAIKSDGLFLLHNIGSPTPVFRANPWVDKYIFPNGVAPSLSQFIAHAEKYFRVEDVHNFGADYVPTLKAWWENFDNNWKGNLEKNYSERFYRMWQFYLLGFAAAFESRYLQLFQAVLSPKGVHGGYASIR